VVVRKKGGGKEGGGAQFGKGSGPQKKVSETKHGSEGESWGKKGEEPSLEKKKEGKGETPTVSGHQVERTEKESKDGDQRVTKNHNLGGRKKS